MPFWDRALRKNEKMKKIVITIILSIIVNLLYCQVDSIEKQILNYDNSKSVIISKGRSLLLDKFLENDLKKVREIKNYLIEKGEDENYVAFYTAELWLILYWTNEYEDLLTRLKEYTSSEYTEYHIYSSSIRGYYSRGYNWLIYPSQDMLCAKLLQYSKENEDDIINQIYFSNLSLEQMRFLQLNFESITRNENRSYQDTLNLKVESFREEFPKSEYDAFIGKYIKYKYVLGKWGAGVEVFAGMNFPTGRLRNSYRDACFGGGAIDIYFKKFEFILRFFGGSYSLKNDIEYSQGFYSKDSTLKVFLPELSFGYSILDNYRLKLAPFVGIGGFFLNTSSAQRKEIPELKELSVSAFAFNFGASFDIRFGQSKPRYKYYPNNDYGGFVRIRYNFCLPIFSKKHDAIGGQLHTVTVGVGLFARDSKREY